jgi:hypothetical protein
MPTESNSLLAVHFCSNTFLFDENKLFPGSAQFSRFSIDLYINHASLLFVQQPLQIAMFNFVRFVSQQLSHKSESFYIVGRTNALEQNSYPPFPLASQSIIVAGKLERKKSPMTSQIRFDLFRLFKLIRIFCLNVALQKFSSTGGRCYDHIFRRYLPIFGEKLAFFS